MRNVHSLLLSAATILASLLAPTLSHAQTDVTSTYVTNASFETNGSTNLDATKTAPTGWTITDSGNIAKYELHNASSVTDNNFGPTAAAAGTYYYYMRMAWATGTTTLSQTLSALPAGSYTLTAKVKTMYANSATSSYYLSAGGQSSGSTTFSTGSTSGFSSLSWSDVSVTFTVSETSNVTIALGITWASGGSQLAVDDFTLTYTPPASGIYNPSFELDDPSGLTAVENNGLRGYTLTDPTGWTVSGTSVTELLVDANCYADNNFGLLTTIPHGSYAYYLRQGWAGGTTYVKQTLTLPAAIYKLSADQRTAYANSATSTLTLYAGDEEKGISFEAGSTNCFTTRAWTNSSLYFELTEETTLELGFRIDWVSGGSCVMLDNVTLEEVDEMPTETSELSEDDIPSTTEGEISATFVSESEMMNDLLQMLADFSPYMVSDFNSVDDTYGYFNGESSGQSNEAGVRTNADLSMICAFLVKYAQPAGITLPNSISYSTLQTMALKSLMWALGTHKANKLRQTTNSAYWGSTSTSDYVWESSLWAMSVAYSAFFQWGNLSSTQKGYLEALLKAECNYELNRTIPTGYSGDTKSEENGWEADILAATLGLFPNDELASQWFERMRAFAINSYSHMDDASSTEVIDSWYNDETVGDLYQGQNLYHDYTLQNHNLFHTSYQNVVMQELGEAALALKLFQTGLGNDEYWKSNSLMHHNQEVMDSVLNWLALTDGELAMPNGNDWSLFLYDQITSYSTQACFQRDANALMLENLAYKFIKARQQTTTDGSWLLRPDVGARRMGVEAHRVMMTYLMHLVNSTADLTPTTWEDFRAARSQAKILPCQNVVRAFTKDRFTTFSWSTGLSSYTGYIASNSVDKNKIIVPFRANNTGNFLGWYTVEGQSTNATPVVSGIYNLRGDAYTMNGEIKTNGQTLDNRFVIYSTPGNAVIYLDHVQALSSGTITGEYGGLMGISVDELTKTTRTLYSGNGSRYQSDGSSLDSYKTNWLNIDNEVGFVSRSDKKMGFGNKAANNSIYTAKIYPSYSTTSRSFASGDIVDRRNITYYSGINAETTAQMEEQLQVLTDSVPTGWNGAIVPDPDGTNYLLLSNFTGANASATLSNIACQLGAPIFETETTISNGKSTATFTAAENNSVANVLKIFISGSNVTAKQDTHNEEAAYLTATANTTVSITIISDGQTLSKDNITIAAGKTVYVSVQDGAIVVTTENLPKEKFTEDDYTSYIVNPTFDGNTTNGWKHTGVTNINYNEVERWNATLDFWQTVENLPTGLYKLSCQGFYRNGGYTAAATSRTNGTESLNAIFSGSSAIDSVAVALNSIFTDANGRGKLGVSTTCGYIPNNMEQAFAYFGAGLYQNNLYVKVGDEGKLCIRIKKGTTVGDDWTIFDNFRLTYIGTGVDGDISMDQRLSQTDIHALIDLLMDKDQVKPYAYDHYTAAHMATDENNITLADLTALINLLLSK